MFNLGERGIVNRLSILYLFVISIGVFVLVKYSQINKSLISLENKAQHFFKSARQSSHEELRDIREDALKTTQQTEQRLNRSFDSYRRKLLEMDENNKSVMTGWKTEFRNLLGEYEEQLVVKEQELDRLIAAYQSRLAQLEEVPKTPVTASPGAEETASPDTEETVSSDLDDAAHSDEEDTANSDADDTASSDEGDVE